MAEAFDELAGLYFKEGSKAGGVYKKVCACVVRVCVRVMRGLSGRCFTTPLAFESFFTRNFLSSAQHWWIEFKTGGLR